jgi:hypothetical protein|eukprot:COSAG01_NODE_4921_length_4617_cov_17.606242_3_plen_98_part_00
MKGTASKGMMEISTVLNKGMMEISTFAYKLVHTVRLHGHLFRRCLTSRAIVAWSSCSRMPPVSTPVYLAEVHTVGARCSGSARLQAEPQGPPIPNKV